MWDIMPLTKLVRLTHTKVEHYSACTKPVNHFMADTHAELVSYGSFYGWHMLYVLLLYV